ncbi:MAG: ABC transporter substrate-binding protein [Tissierellia bacterium]|nr:ABC transporter substrate-binding protein [Tissierellia bacterium]
MNKYFKVTDKVFDITEKYPETIDVFAAHGFAQLKNDKMRRLMGKTISLEMACKTKKVNLDLFEEKLVEAIEQARMTVDGKMLNEKNIKGGDIKIEGILPCPVQLPLMESFEKWLDEKDFDFTIDYDLKVASGGVDWLKERIIKIEDEEELSDLFISAGFDLFFDKRLMGKFKSKGIFKDLTAFDKLNEDFSNDEIDLKDPKGQYSIISVVAAVFLVNKEELGDRRAPETWKDLFKPEFEGEVALPVSDFDLFNAILLNIHKRYGEEGVRKLGRAFMNNMHPAEMVKSHRKKEKPTVTIMPYFFTKMISGNGPMFPVWPKDGAIISPIFLLAKESKKDKIKPFVDFFASKEVGEILSHNGKFPSTHPEVENNLSEDQKFMWLGWDYINKNDIGQLLVETEKIFYEGTKED